MNKIILSIDGMTCSACSNGLEKYLKKQKGIIDASVNLVLAQAMIQYEDLTIDDLNRFVSEAGFTSLGEYKVNEKKKKNSYFWLFTILLILFMYLSMGSMIGLPTLKIFEPMEYPKIYSITLFLLSVVFLIWGRDILKKGIKNVIYKTPNMDTLVTLGVFASFLFSVYATIQIFLGVTFYVHFLYFESVAMVLFFVKLGRYIDSKSKEKTRDAIESLVQITPNMALLKTKDGEKEITIDEVKKGDILICKPGMKVAVDGSILNGTAHFDESFLTGESMPLKKSRDDSVLAGSLNYDGYIEYKALKIGKDSMVSEVALLVMESVNTKTKLSRLADKVSGIFVPVLILIAILTFIGYLLIGREFSESLLYFVNVLVVACPCALGLATPLAIVISEGVCAKKGILVKTSEILENAGTIDTIVFDKTGTLTYGNLKIAKINIYEDYKEKEVMSYVVSLEEKTTHPIREAFLAYAKENKIDLLKVSEFSNIEGMGITGKINDKTIIIGNDKILKKYKIKNDYMDDEIEFRNTGVSIVYVVIDKKIVSLIGVKDMVRKEVKSLIQSLQSNQIDVIMLTGDNEETARLVGETLGITHIIAEVLPKEKNDVIKKLILNGKKVMMVGDGVNDAPALTSSTIGVSISSGTDIASNSADVILMQDNLSLIEDFIHISKKTTRNIKQNLFWAFFYNILMIPVAMGLFQGFGITINPMIASIAMTLSSLMVVFNALRLKRY